MLELKHAKMSLFVALLACFLSTTIFAKTATSSKPTLVKSVKFTGINKIEIALTNKATNFKIFTLSNPERLVIDLGNTNLEKADYKPALPFFVKSFRIKDDENSLRIVFDLTQKLSLKNINFDPKKNLITGEIDGIKNTPSQTNNDFISNKVAEFEVETKKVINPDGSAKYIVKKTYKNPRIPVIVIDAGHGGKDPGTIGNFARSKEKNITLSHAKELGKQLVNTGRYKVYLTRDDDVFIPLFLRVEKARKKKADLFISLHANAIIDHEISGFSIYTLSEKASDKRAELLAQKENQADIINGVDFSGASRDVMKTLIDLSQRQSKNSSSNFANNVIKSVKTSEIEILQNTHRFAGFVVLTAPDMVSTLIELGYLSNKEEEKLLNSIYYKRKIAASLVGAIDEYFAKNKI